VTTLPEVPATDEDLSDIEPEDLTDDGPQDDDEAPVEPDADL
jgi:hypothetical protein